MPARLARKPTDPAGTAEDPGGRPGSRGGTREFHPCRCERGWSTRALCASPRTAREPSGALITIRARRGWLRDHLCMAMADAVRDPLDSLLTIPEAAERAGLSGTTIRRQVDNGSPRRHKLGRLRFINEDELAEDSAKWNRTRSEDGHPFPGGYGHESVWAALLALYELEEPVTAAELAIATDRDPGNTRKYLTGVRSPRIRSTIERIGVRSRALSPGPLRAPRTMLAGARKMAAAPRTMPLQPRSMVAEQRNTSAARLCATRGGGGCTRSVFRLAARSGWAGWLMSGPMRR